MIARSKKPKVRCAIYTRKSTDDGLEQEFNSLDAQRQAGESIIASQKIEGWSCIKARYDDGGFSGGTVERPGLKKLLADIEAGKIDCVVVYKVDRLSRSLLDFAKMMEVFDTHGVSFVSVTQQFNTTHSMGRLTLNILLSFAQFEREIIGERIRDKIAAQRKRGQWAGGIPVLGYDVDRSGPTSKLVVNGEEAARLRQIFALYLELGSLLPLVDELVERGWCNKAWKTKKGEPRGGRPFDKGSLHALLTNPIFAGKIKHKSEVYDGQHEAIVDFGVFQEVQRRLAQNGHAGGSAARNKHGALLRGLLYCKACQRAMTHTFTTKGERRYRYYTCTRAIQEGRRRCPSRSLPALELEEAVVDEIRSLTKDRQLRREVVQQAQQQSDAEQAALRSERDDLKCELVRHQKSIRSLLADGEAAGGTAAGLADLNEQIARAEQRIVEIDEQLPLVAAKRLERKDVTAALGDFDELWAALGPREQARVLSLLMARIEFDAEDGNLAMTFHPAGIKILATQTAGAAS